MARPGGNMIQYGKVSIVSDAVPLSEMKKMLSEILEKHGYPEEEPVRQEEQKEGEDEEGEEGDEREREEGDDQRDGEEATPTNPSLGDEESEEMGAGEVYMPPWMKKYVRKQ